jgi:hypothetical protein
MCPRDVRAPNHGPPNDDGRIRDSVHVALA